MGITTYWRSLSPRTRFFLIVIAIFIVAWRYHVHHKNAMQGNSGDVGTGTFVSASNVISVSWQATEQASGNIKASKSINVTSVVAGIIETIDFQSGQQVHQGQLLATLRSDDIKALVKKAAATLHYDQEKYQQQAALLTKHFVAKTDVDALQAQVNADQAALEQAVAELAQYTISAPFSGTVGIQQVDIGQYLHAGDAIVNLEDLDPAYVDFQIPERLITKLKVGGLIDVVSDAVPNGHFSGKIVATGAHIDEATRSLAVRAEVANPKQQLLSGMAATVTIPIQQFQALVIPQTALGFDPNGTFIFKIDAQHKVHQVYVTTGERDDDRVVITSGLHAGDRVVSAGVQKCHDGDTVQINQSISVPGTATFHPNTDEASTP